VEQVTTPNGASAFDAQRPPSQEIIEKCVHCGFCLPVCPTYVLWGEEMDSPRGRIYLMKMASEGKTPMSPQWVSHFDSCLGCVACMTACPSGVDYGKLIEATRAQIERHHKRSLGEQFHRWLLFVTLTKPERLNVLRWPLLFYQKSGIQAVLRHSGLLRLLPKSAGVMEALLPDVGKIEKIEEITTAERGTRRRVGLMLGCVQRTFFSHVNAATVRVLAAEGCEVVVPREQPCCGALLVHTGEEERAMELARGTIDAFERAQVDTIVTNAAGCGSNVKEYAHLMRDDPGYAERAKKFSACCKDISELLAEMEPRAARKLLPLRVAFHDSCHLLHAQGVRSQPRSLLAQIPGLELLEIPESPICCGSAGIYNLVQPEAASALGERKAQLIAPLQPDVVVTGNPGCMMQLQTSLAGAGSKIPVKHTIELIDASIRGLPAESLRRGVAK
jgi:glycolate oxidase iron-sulfur subunit